MSVSGGKQPYLKNILPSNVDGPIELPIGKLFGGFRDIRSVSKGMNKASFRELIQK